MCLSTVVGYTIWAHQAKRIAYVDSAKLLNSYVAMAEARKSYATKAQVWQARIDTLGKEVQQAVKNYEHMGKFASAGDRALAGRIVSNKQNSLANYQRIVQETAKQEEEKSTQLVLNQVNAFLKRYGEEEGYDLILIASPTGSIAYAKQGLDLTDDIVKKLNSEYRKQSN
ncbi:OmpH family outer membrane protein [Hymenobacter sublimis]|uniref:OmpH family outer membrane protein n=1 Tax=Hymenobacter sublimis TaxID=2933777 RepID=A0ABY4JBJ7_9BACT|nr:OmpH family outer membrane protein [Hymenobacter sublimis]UPL50199.1 OmpH family outer membrane protein [Hymenobacter sublimis]